MTLLRGIRDEYFKRSFLNNKPKTTIELRLRVEKYINSEEVFQVVDDLDLSNLGVVKGAKAGPSFSSAHPKLSIGKRPTNQERDVYKKKPKYDN